MRRLIGYAAAFALGVVVTVAAVWVLAPPAPRNIRYERIAISATYDPQWPLGLRLEQRLNEYLQEGWEIERTQEVRGVVFTYYLRRRAP